MRERRLVWGPHCTPVRTGQGLTWHRVRERRPWPRRHDDLAYAALAHAAHAFVDACDGRAAADFEDEGVELRRRAGCIEQRPAARPRREGAQARVDKVAIAPSQYLCNIGRSAT